ncbi:hypothetical protein [Streptomyces filamentosus]|uniref:hypothetical protein n=1 Tax=Streptomyces filamentosus TaxID=67294 RepID=UPI0037D01528
MIALGLDLGGMAVGLYGIFVLIAHRNVRTFNGAMAITNTLFAASNSADSSPVMAGFNAAAAALMAWLWWNGGGGDNTKRRLRRRGRAFTPVRRRAPASV